MTCGQIMYMLLQFDSHWKPPCAYDRLKCILSKQQARDTTLVFNNDFMNQKLLSHEIDRKWREGGGVVERFGRSGIMGNLEAWRLSLSHYLRKVRMSALPRYSKVSITLCSLWFKQHCFHTGYTVHNKPLKVPNKCEIACDVFSPSLFTLCALIMRSHDRSISPLFISCRNRLSLIGATRNISKQETGCSPNSIHQATSKSVSPQWPLSSILLFNAHKHFQNVIMTGAQEDYDFTTSWQKSPSL